MSVKYRYHTILVVDIEGFGRRRNPVQSWLRGRLRQVLEDAFDAAGVDVLAGPPPVDRGDGVFWLLPATVPKEDVTGPFVEALARGLREHAGTSSANGALRLRLALHGGEVGADEQGWVGADLNTACRMVDHQPLRDALADVPEAGLVVTVSDEWHRKVISHHHPGIDAAQYRPVRFDAKEIRNETVWVRVPGHAWSPRSGTAPVAASAAEPDDRAERGGRERRAAGAAAVRIEQNSGIGQLFGDIRDGGIGVAHGGVRQDFGPRAAEGPPDNATVLRELKALRVQLQAALERREIDAETYEDAAGELDTAEECAGDQDERSHGRLVRALLKLGALVEGVGVIAEPVRTLINLLRGGE